MSKNNNVNPGQYKVAGRERPGEDVSPRARQRAKGAQRASSRGGAAKTTKRVARGR
jgi:hypothetical protein